MVRGLAPPPAADVFCRVIDNFGDVGVTWRLARQLVAEHGIRVRLALDKLQAAAILEPDIDPQRAAQRAQGVEVLRWDTALAMRAEADLVIEAFGCELPERYVSSMAEGAAPPVWINLEYLSAEPWVVSHHGLPSPRPDGCLTKHFFFPGFGAGTGGLIRERELARPARPAASHGEPPRRALVFAYPNAPLATLGRIAAAQSMRLTVPTAPGLADKPEDRSAVPANHALKGTPGIDFVPFVPQRQFDSWLRQFDLLFVRGEDSLVRALWSGTPFIWNVYPQTEQAHRRKLEAFVAWYTRSWEPGLKDAYRAASLAWNRLAEADLAVAWPALRARFAAWQSAALRSCEAAWEFPDLASNLLSFYGKIAKL